MLSLKCLLNNIFFGSGTAFLTVSDQAALLSAYITVCSFAVVYHLISLQMWLSRFMQILDKSESIAVQYPIESIERRICVKQAKMHLSAFPKLSCISIGFIQIVLSWLIFQVNLGGPLAPIFLLTPIFILLIVFFGSTFFIWREGKKICVEIVSNIGDLEK